LFYCTDYEIKRKVKREKKMSKIALVATSTSSLDYLDVNDPNLSIIRMKILMGDDTYNDFTDITAQEFYTRLRNEKTLVPSSSMPAIGEVFEELERLENAGYNEAIITTISSQLSGTYEMCLLVQKQYEGKMKVHVFDTRNAAISEGFLALEALKMIDEGKTSTEIIEYLTKLRINRKQYFMVDNLRLFVANGRLSGASGFVGSMFKIKPILEVNDDGKIVSFEKVRTQKKSLARMVELIIDDLRNVKNFVVTFDASDNVEGLEFVISEIEKEFPGFKYYDAPITPVVGCHTGVGTVGIAYFDLDV